MANVVVIAQSNDETLGELEHLPPGAKVVLVGAKAEDFKTPEGKEALATADIMLNCAGAAELLSSILPAMPNLKWMHNRFAGVDHVMCPVLKEHGLILTNAQGCFSSSLAEYCMLACLYFAKDAPRWKRQQREQLWEKFPVSELRGSTIGIIGYGDIGAATGRLAKAFGMRVLAQRRRPELCNGDGICDAAFGSGGVGDVIEQSDYICVTAALTPETRGMVGPVELARAKPSAVLLNVGRGPLVDEPALLAALRDGRLRGAALDVFDTEPLPRGHPLWAMEDKVLLSPHNADMTRTFLHESVRAFVGAVPRFLAGEPSGLHEVDKDRGY